MFFGWFDAIFSFIFPILFLLFIGMFFFALISNLRTWNKNNHSPRLTVPATVVAKRTDVSHSSSANAGDMSGAHGYDTSTFTSYYVTFQVEWEYQVCILIYGGASYAQTAQQLGISVKSVDNALQRARRKLHAEGIVQ